MANAATTRLDPDADPYRAKLAPKKKAPAYYKITLDDNENIPPSGQFFQLNGRSWMLKGGATYVIPLGLKEILDNAIESAPQVNPETQQLVGYRNRMRFPYRLISSGNDPDDLMDD